MISKRFTISIICILTFVFLFIYYSKNSDEKQKYLSNVFKPWDGNWSGDFIVYLDTLGQQKGNAQPTDIDFDIINKPSFILQSVIKADHIYKSVSSFRQEGIITDIVTSGSGKPDTIKSKAVNEVKNGKLKCLVYKPNELGIHEGKYLGDNTIVWQRSLSNPLKIEYFKETVRDGHYKIIGWGYYGKDNPTLTPRYWFYADYMKID